MSRKTKRLLLLNLPYALFALLGTKLGQSWRYAPGFGFSEKFLHLMEGMAAAFQTVMPSFQPFEMLSGILIAAIIRLAVYLKGKNAKKFRKNTEYGSARWGTAADIAPFMDEDFRNNIILTQTEMLTMNNRPPDPKTARNKNVTITPARMLMYGKEASNRKQEIDRQHYTIPNQRPKDKHCGKI